MKLTFKSAKVTFNVSLDIYPQTAVTDLTKIEENLIGKDLTDVIQKVLDTLFKNNAMKADGVMVRDSDYNAYEFEGVEEDDVDAMITWLRKEHKVYYTPNNELLNEKKKVAEQQKKIGSYETTLSKITDIMEPKYAGPAWSETWDDLAERIKRMKEKSETLKAESTDWMNSFTKAQDSRSAFCKKLKEELNVDYRYPGSFPKMEEDILAEVGRLKKEHDDVRGLSLKIEELEEQLREKANENSVLRGNVDYFADLAQGRQKALSNLHDEIDKVYREIFDCSNGDPEGTYKETLQDILTEYKRVLKMKDDAETDKVTWRPYIADILGMDTGSDWSDICTRARVIRHDRDNLDLCLKMLKKHIKESYSEVFPDDTDRFWFGNYRQTVTDTVEALKREREIKEEFKQDINEWQRWFDKVCEELGTPARDFDTVLDELRNNLNKLNKLNELSGTSNEAMDALRKLYEYLIGPCDFDDSPHDIATRIKRCFTGIKSREQKNKMISDNHAEEAKEYYQRTVELKRELETVREDLIEWIKGLRSVYTHVKGHEPPLEASPSATASVCKYEIDAMKTKMRDLEQKLSDIKDICDGNSDVMNIIG